MSDARPWTVLKRNARGKIVVASRHWTLDEATRKAAQLRREGIRPFIAKTRNVRIA